MTGVVNSCALYGSFTNANNWIGINYLVIIVGFSIVAVIYSLSRLLPAAARANMAGVTKVEITQLIISTVIIAVLIASSSAACSIAVAISQSVSGNSYTPFVLADSYIGNLIYNKGLAIYGQIYVLSITYDIYSKVLAAAGGLISSLIPGFGNLFEFSSPSISIKGIVGYDAAIGLGIFSTLLVVLFSPLVILAVGMLFIQYLAIPIIEYTMFTIVLPIAIAMRSLAFAGQGLRTASNAVLAIAVAAYLIYPVTIGFDSYVMSWLFSPSNPSYPFLESTYSHITTIPSTFFSTTGIPAFGSSTYPSISSVLSMLSASGFLSAISFSEPLTIVNEISELMFQAVLLFALNIAITIGFATSLANALNSGIGGAVSFWSNI
ncbi:MAG: hypothetical protein QXK65_02845 [Candidatus Micrarchaeaceae archaeon]